MRFLDTDCPELDAISRDPEERDKARRADEILASGGELALSVQVLQEFDVQATRRSRAHPLTHEQAVRLVASFLRFPVQELTTAIMLEALETHRRFGISYWDAVILAAAGAARCEIVLSEDLTHGMDYGGVRVENPFRDLETIPGPRS